jgi:nucleotide-binding universal stress UspA family protein
LPALDAAFAFAQRMGSEVILLHVIETIEHIEINEMKSFYERLATSARVGLQEFSARFDAENLPVERAVIYGHRTGDILAFAIQKQVDLIILASHRVDPERPGHDWSSISYAVAILSPCPVLLVKGTEPGKR